MTEDELEQAVRETFARRVAVAHPLAADPAGLAIRRADRARRRRTVAGLALAAVTTVGISAGIAQLGQQPGRPTHPTVVLGDPYASPLPNLTPTLPVAPPTDPAQSAGRGEVDLILGAVLATTSGQRLTLSGVGPAERAQRLPDGTGWAVVGAPTAAGQALWVVQPDGGAHLLLAGARDIALSRDGRQVAWREGTELVAAGIVGTQVVGAARTPVPVGAAPVGFAGDAVLVRLDAQRPGHALWRPARGPLKTEGDRATLRVYGTRPDGVVVAQVSAGAPRRPCLALLDPARDLAPARTGCGPTLGDDGHGGVSADGRWLLVNGRAGGEERALLVDLDRLGDTAAVRPAGPPAHGPVAWTPEGTAYYSDARAGLVRVDVSRVLAGEESSSAPVNGLGDGQRPIPVGRDGS
ncbi:MULTISPECIES: hypothetical protein [unclassified Micromonospora]|uniref:hypothetical protein n=1 Tax=unclassified Micromonospora TaxID=2617518 RepID=UPI0033218D02